METKVITSSWIKDFIGGLEFRDSKELEDSILLLRTHGYTLSMPDAKPVGKGLWELRISSNTAIRILYGFCDGYAILLLGFKKQQNAIPRREFDLAQKRLKDYCQ